MAPFEGEWEKGCWEENCIMYIRAGADLRVMDGALERAYRTAERNRKRCIVVLENGKREVTLEKLHRGAAAEAGAFRGQTVEVIPLITFHKGTTLWSGSDGWGNSWYSDVNGAYQGTEEDGSMYT